MTEKRFYYNTFYHADDMSRVLEYEIIDRQSYPNYPNHDEKEDVPNWYIYIGENDSGWQDMLVKLLNALHEENVKLRARNKYLATKIQRERNIHVKEHEKWENEIQKENEQLKHDATVLIQANQDYRRENEQLKTTISRLIEQNRKNNDLLVSDIRLLEKALWCPNCTINIKRLRELKKEFEK